MVKKFISIFHVRVKKVTLVFIKIELVNEFFWMVILDEGWRKMENVKYHITRKLDGAKKKWYF
jgi:hypothetical protein